MPQLATALIILIVIALIASVLLSKDRSSWPKALIAKNKSDPKTLRKVAEISYAVEMVKDFSENYTPGDTDEEDRSAIFSLVEKLFSQDHEIELIDSNDIFGLGFDNEEIRGVEEELCLEDGPAGVCVLRGIIKDKMVSIVLIVTGKSSLVGSTPLEGCSPYLVGVYTDSMQPLFYFGGISQASNAKVLWKIRDLFSRRVTDIQIEEVTKAQNERIESHKKGLQVAKDLLGD